VASQKRVVAHKRCFIILIIVLQGTIRYQVVGEYPAPSLFSVDPVGGQVQIIRSVREDTTATVYNVKYYCRMKTYCLMPHKKKNEQYKFLDMPQSFHFSHVMLSSSRDCNDISTGYFI
jgi:hypothetical protein